MLIGNQAVDGEGCLSTEGSWDLDRLWSQVRGQLRAGLRSVVLGLGPERRKSGSGLSPGPAPPPLPGCSQRLRRKARGSDLTHSQGSALLWEVQLTMEAPHPPS